MTHPTCDRCQMVLVLVYIDGQQVLVCPRATCTQHGRSVSPLTEPVTDPNGQLEL